jgi:predicted NBD/HSP70 family sugar kinase
MASHSETALAREVLIHGPLSRSALTARLELSPASLTRLAKPLLDSGLLVELDERADGSVGRPSRPLDISPDAGQFIGIKLTGDHLYAVATGIRAEPITWTDHPLADRVPDHVIDDIVRTVAELGLPEVAGIGVSLGGFVRDGVAEHAPFLRWDGVDLAGPLTDLLGVPVTIENDIVALAEAERWFGAGRDVPGFAIITVGAGVGYGLVIDGHAVRTVDAGAGTGGHIPLSDHGPVCPDGHRGCARALLTSGSITAQVSAALERPVTYDEVLTLAAAGEPAARTVVDAAGEALGRFIALAANLTLQPFVVLAGEGMAIYDLVTDLVVDTIRAHRDPHAEPVVIQVDSSGFHAWARGAAAVAIQSAMRRIPAP